MLEQLQFGSDGEMRKEEATVHRKQQEGVYYSAVYTSRPPYADYPPRKNFLLSRLLWGNV